MPMNTANKLTLARVFMIPLFLVIAYWGFPGSRYVALEGILRNINVADSLAHTRNHGSQLPASW